MSDASRGGDSTRPQQPPPPPRPLPPAWLDVAAGVFAGAANVVAGHPFDTVKVVLQAGNPGQHAGALDATRHILRQGGVRSLYRGVASPLVGGALETAVNYSVYNAARRRLADSSGATRPSPRFGETGDSLAAGAVAGVALSVVLGPAELVKCRVQAGGDAGVAAALTRIFRDHGMAGFTRGMGATLVREVPGNAIFFASYEALQRASPGGQSGQGGMSAVLCGGLAGMIYWSAVLPIDTAKTRLQVATPCRVQDMGLLGHMRDVYAQRGFRRGLYAGAGPVMLRAFVANAVQWAAWEAATKRLHEPA